MLKPKPCYEETHDTSRPIRR